MYTTTTKNPKQDGFEDEYLAGEIDTKGTTNETQFMGSAVFKEGRMIGTLNGEDTRLALILDETAYIKDVLTTYSDPFDKRFRIATRLIRTQENKVDIKIQQGKAKVKIKVPLIIEVLSNPSMVDYAKDEKKKKKLKKHLENELEEKNQKFVDMTQSELEGSPFSLSLYSRKLFPAINDYKKFDWMKSYPDADIDVEVSVKLGEFGKQTKVPNLEKIRD
jgi:spore germination protein KC